MLVYGLGQVAGLVHRVDEMASDQALSRVDGRKVELRREVVVQACFARERRLEVRGFAVEAAAAGVRPRRRGERDGVAARRRGAVRHLVLEDVLEARVVLAFELGPARAAVLGQPVVGRRLALPGVGAVALGTLGGRGIFMSRA